MKNIRHGVFETNSSSTHSLTIKPGNHILKFPENDEGKIVIDQGEFGWEVVDYHDAYTKASYCYTDNVNDGDRLEMLKDVIMEVTGKEVVFGNISGYVDHQSCGTSNDAFVSRETLKDFIFNPKSVLHTDNDNH